MGVEIKWGDDLEKVAIEDILNWLARNAVYAGTTEVPGAHKLQQLVGVFRNYVLWQNPTEEILKSKEQIRQKVLAGYKPEE